MKDSKRRYERRVSAGECVQCGTSILRLGANPDGMNYRTCGPCRERHYARRRLSQDVRAKQRT